MAIRIAEIEAASATVPLDLIFDRHAGRRQPLDPRIPLIVGRGKGQVDWPLAVVRSFALQRRAWRKSSKTCRSATDMARSRSSL